DEHGTIPAGQRLAGLGREDLLVDVDVGPDVLDVVVVFEGLHQPQDLVDLVRCDVDGGLGHHRQLLGDGGSAAALELLLDGDVVLHGGVDLVDVLGDGDV